MRKSLQEIYRDPNYYENRRYQVFGRIKICCGLVFGLVVAFVAGPLWGSSQTAAAIEGIVVFSLIYLCYEMEEKDDDDYCSGTAEAEPSVRPNSLFMLKTFLVIIVLSLPLFPRGLLVSIIATGASTFLGMSLSDRICTIWEWWPEKTVRWKVFF
ncbi:MAG: hypothetical protein PHV42_02410 [Candidatus Pacebacteria bacterium]|nr:hypothetical protein [Candidatus Paceibacterota bacterium]